MNDHIDVRGQWPVYVRGDRTVRLEGQDRNISIEDARTIADAEFDRQDRDCLNVEKDPHS